MEKNVKEKLLTVIIPFLNEGNEVENTLQSVRDTAGDSIDILIINDCSTDNFDYKTIALQYNAVYHENEKRIGVAASRDLGVELSQTPYFLLLDAHMRFYQEGWVNRIVDELKTDEKLLLCCQTKALDQVDEKVIEDTQRQISFGAYVGLEEVHNSLDAVWIWDKKEFDCLVDNYIPCVLGAAYASGKKYWQFLKGLNGLISYGSDEVYISFKVWLTGGHCKFLEDIEVGHIYRKIFPYEVKTIHTTYNKMLISETLLPDKYKKRIFRKLKSGWKEVYGNAYQLYYENISFINLLKEYYKQIVNNDFETILQLNRKIDQIILTQGDREQMLKRIAYHIILQTSSISDIGLLYGKMGCILFLFHYARYIHNHLFEEIAGYLLEDVQSELSSSLSIDMESGYCGIAWGINYLLQQGFVKGDSSEILEDVDKKIMERDPKRMTDYTFEKGLAGILFYVSERIRVNGKGHPFDSEYILRLSNKTEEILSSPDAVQNKDFDFLLEYSGCLLNKENARNPFGLYDLICMDIPDINLIEKYPLGLQNGCAGIGLKLILDSQELE